MLPYIIVLYNNFVTKIGLCLNRLVFSVLSQSIDKSVTFVTCNILDTSVLTHTQSVVALDVIVGQ